MNKSNLNLSKTSLNIDGNKIQLTKDGFLERQKRLKELIDLIRPQVLEEWSEARSQGDLSENADYDAAKNKQAEIEQEINYLENLLTRVEIVKENKNKSVVKIGSTIVYKNLESNREITIKIVGSIESDPMSDIPKIGTNSPIALAILNAKIGDKKEVVTDVRKYFVEIIKII